MVQHPDPDMYLEVQVPASHTSGPKLNTDEVSSNLLNSVRPMRAKLFTDVSDSVLFFVGRVGRDGRELDKVLTSNYL